MLKEYRQHVTERAELGIPPLALNVQQTRDLVTLLLRPPKGDAALLLQLLAERVPNGVDQAAQVKADFLHKVATLRLQCPIVDPSGAVDMLGTMQGGYNIHPLIDFLDDPKLAQNASMALKKTILMFDAAHDVANKAAAGNDFAKQVVQSWADARWFLDRPKVPDVLQARVFKIEGEINTDDLSPAAEAWSRADIPLHARSMLVARDKDAIAEIQKLAAMDYPVVFVADVVGTGSSRKSAINSLLWHIGKDIPFVPNKRQGGIIIGSKIAPIFFNTAEDSGALPIEADVSAIEHGQVININLAHGAICDQSGDNVLVEFTLRPDTLVDEIRAGGRIPLIIGRGLTDKTRQDLGLAASTVFLRPKPAAPSTAGFTLAQKMVGRACGVRGIRPGTYCEPRVSTVGSQDTTGAMTRDELKELACLGFSADFVLQSFCHTAAYPKLVDIALQKTLPGFMHDRGGVALHPGDGIIHSWLNRMLLPDAVGTGGDSHTRFPLGISFPAGSGLVAFAAALGVLPLDMPESVLVRFSGQMQAGITLRDLVNAIAYVALQQGLLTLNKQGKKNVYSGRVMEIEGLAQLQVEQAFELADASAERSANGCTIRLNSQSVTEYLRSNMALIKWMIANGYQDQRTLKRRYDAMQDWLDRPQLIEPDADAHYAETVAIDLSKIKEPLLACPNDPDNIKPLSQVQGTKVDEVFIGSCMTNIGHYRAAAKILEGSRGLPVRLWVVPPTRMDERQLIDDGCYAVFGQAGARTETPGCSLCMGNQARVDDGATVVSTSTRNFPNRMGKDANVFLCSAELAAVTAKLGKIPSMDEYLQYFNVVQENSNEIYRYLNFNEMADYSVDTD